MAHSRKKVLIRLHTGKVIPGYLPTRGLLAGDRQIPLLDLEARISAIPPAEVRWIAYVRDFNLDDPIDPERLIRRTFLARPRTEGLWVRLTLGAGDILEGLAPLDRSLLDAVADDDGIYLIPPDIRSNTQRLFLPRTSFLTMQIVGVILAPSRAKPATPVTAPASQQKNLFP